MPRPLLVVMLAAAAVCAGVGALLLQGSRAADFGWTAYAPLAPGRAAQYVRFDTTWSVWRPIVGEALLALGAGTTGATLVALLLRRRAHPGADGRPSAAVREPATPSRP